MHTLFSFLKTLSPTDVVVTPNQRLAATLHRTYQDWQRDQQKISWMTPAIFPFTVWLEKLFKNYIDVLEQPPVLLTAFQEHIVFQEVIQRAPDRPTLLPIIETTQLALKAWQLLKQWNISHQQSEIRLTEEGHQFSRWAKQFEKKCQAERWIDRASLAHYLIQGIQQDTINLPARLICVGFLEITPQLQLFLNACQSKITILWIDKMRNQREQPPHRISLPNSKQEIITMANWAKKTRRTTTGLIGCIVPELENNRDLVKQIFEEVFEDHSEKVYNVSAGKKLSQYPLIYTALQLLHLSKFCPIEKLGHLLRSPFLKEAETEKGQRALYDIHLREKNHFLISLKKVAVNTLCPLFANSILELFPTLLPASHRLSPSEWVAYFTRVLTIMGWPGERSVNSEEYQLIHHAWLPLLAEFHRLDCFIPQLSLKQALSYLTQLTESTVFQPQSPQTQIQILGALEASSIPFEAIWVTGLDDSRWPAKPSPNPFIPIALQKKYNFPNASAERELTYSQNIIDHFVNFSKQSWFSYAEQENDSALRPSRLIHHFQAVTLTDMALPDFISRSEIIYATQKKEIIDLDPAPLLTEAEKKASASLFKLQASCPFRAFAEIRLKAKKFEEPIPGLTPSERGQIIHQVLQLIWLTLKDSNTLHTLSETHLNELVETSIQITLEPRKLPFSIKKNTRYLSIEKKRLKKLLLRWLTLEKTRGPFKISSLEEERTFSLNALTITVRTDRIDELPTGEKIIIDYKTGRNHSIYDWFGDRPNDPQLPLYSFLPTTTYQGLIFASLHPDTLGFQGISENPMDIPQVKSFDTLKQMTLTWSQQMESFKITLLQLADDFIHGHAAVNPKQAETCRHCHLQALCRVHT